MVPTGRVALSDSDNAQHHHFLQPFSSMPTRASNLTPLFSATESNTTMLN
ncbi:hypothetical protein K443DRAFT_16006 [Laccaria amethystina LaAM-08-1]|uniref:Uncharacterized protein n=1 Tax=Laccaria amethystina LaAM-08-1 TaxID=1095629 RepID=A0A0C9WKL5_9AGAR|nr:hypothetical protein K443DRAFT_16006 [Laccaria amethystina LaAM-08-1]